MRADLLLIGFGNVGRRFARLLEERRDRLSHDYDLDTRIVGITTRSHGAVFSPSGVNVEESLVRIERESSLGTPQPAARMIDALAESDAPMRVVIETTTLNIEDGRPAIAHVESALEANCDVVTANKGPAAFAYARLDALAHARGREFLFEGAVMDGIPVFNLVRETMPAVTVRGFRGVVNSTTNHIISALEDGETFAPALARMQAEGIAEADPSLDVDGWDAAAKASALANVLMNANITPHDVLRTGLDTSTEFAVQDAMSRGNRLRLVASATRDGDGNLVVTVKPEELPGTDVLAGLRGMANALILQTDLLGEVAIHQLSGSLTQTAYALLSDLISIRRRRA
jgi:homoserine dehydrogenase